MTALWKIQFAIAATVFNLWVVLCCSKQLCSIHSLWLVFQKTYMCMTLHGMSMIHMQKWIMIILRPEELPSKYSQSCKPINIILKNIGWCQVLKTHSNICAGLSACLITICLTISRYNTYCFISDWINMTSWGKKEEFGMIWAQQKNLSWL